jgi:hypothetical protein
MNVRTHNPAAVAQPWYREPWPWLLMAGPALVVVAGFVTAWLAVSSADGLVDDDYYKQGLAVNQRVARDARAAELGLRAEVHAQAVTAGEAPELRVFLRGGDGFVPPDQLQLRITHPTRSGFDQQIVLHAAGTGLYSGRLSAPLPGRWHVAIEDADRDWRLVGEWNLDRQAVLSLPAPASEAPRPITYHGR